MDVSKGNCDGSATLIEFAKWRIAARISVLTVYAFLNRDPREVASLMTIFAKFCDELHIDALQRSSVYWNNRIIDRLVQGE